MTKWNKKKTYGKKKTIKSKTAKALATSNAKKINKLIKRNTIKYYPVDEGFRFAVNDPINSLGQIDDGVNPPTAAVYNLTQRLMPHDADSLGYDSNENLTRLDRFVILTISHFIVDGLVKQIP